MRIYTVSILANKPFRLVSSLTIILALITPICPASAATVTASGTNASSCNQTVSDASNVTAVRLANGDCVITFKSGTVNWTTPSGLESTQLVIVGGGGGGGSGYNNGGAGGGGGGQVTSEASFVVRPNETYSIEVGAGGAGGAGVSGNENLGVAGSDSKISLNGSVLLTSLGGGGGSRSRANISGVTDRQGGPAATLNAASIGGGRGANAGSAGGGGGSAGAGSTGSSSATTSLTAGGLGTQSEISGTGVAETFGNGGSGGRSMTAGPALAGDSAATNSGNGGGGASTASSTFAAGGSGGSGIVILRFAPVFLPGAPTITSVTGGDKSLTIYFSSGASNGSVISTYKYSLNGSSLVSANTPSSPIKINNLLGRFSYAVTLYSTNGLGDSVASNEVRATTFDSAADKFDRDQQEIKQIFSILPNLAKLAENLGNFGTAYSGTVKYCIKGNVKKKIKISAKCPKGFKVK